jgi:S1-C subfamily serine protease
MRTPILLLALGTATIVLSGCGVVADAPPKRKPVLTIPGVVRLAPVVDKAAHVRVRPLQRDSTKRAAEEMTARIRNTNCEGLSLGSGFAVDPHVLITNRHVLAGASELEVNTWDGHDLSVTAAKVGALGDLGIAVTDGTLPRVAAFGKQAQAGDLVTVVGYPLGGPLSFSSGTVVDRVDGTEFGIDGSVLRLTARVEHGNSGGPVLNTKGQVVAVVFAIEIATGFGLAIPTDTLVTLARSGGLEDLPPCGSN